MLGSLKGLGEISGLVVLGRAYARSGVGGCACLCDEVETLDEMAPAVLVVYDRLRVPYAGLAKLSPV